MKWKGEIKSTLIPRKSANDYGVEPIFDYEKRDLIVEDGDVSTTSGLHSFIQSFQIVLHRKPEPWANIGLLEYIPNAQDEKDFMHQCEILASKIVSDTNGNDDGIGHTVETIYSITQSEGDGINYLDFEMKITGVDEKISIQVPFVTDLDHE